MGDIGDAVSYTILALGFVIMIFLGALFFVQVSRRGSRRFKWWRGRRTQEPEAIPRPTARNRSGG
jgi:hypothetical protein